MGRAGLLLTIAAAACALAPAGARADCLPLLCPPTTPAPPPPTTPAPPPPPAPVVGDVTGTVAAEGANPAHTGYVADPTLRAPLTTRWTRALTSGSGQPLYGDGRIYAVVDGALRAIDPASGRDIWSVPVGVGAKLGAFDSGRLFTTDGGAIHAYSAADGHELWTAGETVDPDRFGALPVAGAGRVYATTESGTSRVYAFDGATGAVVWRGDKGDGTDITPAIAGTTVFAALPCGATYAIDAGTGRNLWTAKPASCTGLRGVAAVSGDRLYVPQNATVYDARTGAAVQPFSGFTPLVAKGVAVFPSYANPDTTTGTALRAVAVDTGRELWRHNAPSGPVGGPHVSAGDAAPLIVGASVYTMQAGRIAAFDVQAGGESWEQDLPLNGVDDQAYLAAAPGLLVVAGTRRMIGLESLFRPSPDGIDVKPAPAELRAGHDEYFGGMVGTKLRAGHDSVVIEQDSAPFGRRWRTLGRARLNADGYFLVRLRVDRNVRLRARAGGAASRAVTVYADPRYRIGLRALSPRRLRISFTVKGPRISLAGRRVFVYLGRQRAHRLQRLGSGRLHRAGTARSTGVAVVPLPAHAHRKDFVSVCVVGGVRLGLGRPTVLDRHCGAPSVRFKG